MKRKVAKKPDSEGDCESLVVSIIQIHQQAREFAVKAVNVGLTLRNWLIGNRIVEFEQQGRDRAVYGESLMESLSQRLGAHGLPRVTPRELRRYRQFYQVYPRIWESVTPKSLAETDSILPRPEGPPKRRGEQRTHLETFFEKFKLFADLERGQDALALSGQDFASLSLCGSGFVAGYQQQHLPRLSTMRTKGGFLFSGPRIFRRRCA